MTNRYSRRAMLKTTGAGVALLTVPVFARRARAGTASSSNAFAVPPLDRGKRLGGRVTFALTLQRGESSFFPGTRTPTLGINAAYSGPVLRARRGDEVILRVKNEIGEESVIHWHGFRVPAAMDGGPHQAFADGKSSTSRFQIRQRGSTCWYHSHQHEQTGPQVYRGLAGMFIVDDDEIESLDLPARYGVDDIPVIIQDRDFNADGSFRYVRTMQERMLGKHGSTVLVNGVVSPILRAESTLLRLRLMNGSNARIYNLAFDDGREFQVVASDGGLLAQAATVRQLKLGPGERAEVVVDVADRKEVVLRSLRGATGGGGCRMGAMAFDRTLDIMTIDARDAETSAHRRPRQLIGPALLKPDDAAVTRSIRLSMGMMGGGMDRGMRGRGRRGGRMGGGAFTINGRTFDMNRVDFSARRDVPELWVVSNDSAMPHPFHVHNTQFQILDSDGRRVVAQEAGLKDTVLVNPQETVRLLMVFRDYSDPDLPYMYHCHNLEHEDQGMMGQFTVV